MPLEEYRKKRRFGVTPEPAGAKSPKKRAKGLAYVIQKHRATALHYDFRLEWNGVLLSWAVPKGPSLDPSVKRMAQHVEDHPLEYAAFEGIIPAGEYGGGTVMVWDRGTWAPESPDVDAALKKGDLKFTPARREAEGLVGPRPHEGLGQLVEARLAPHQAPRRFRLRRGHRRDAPALRRLEPAPDGDRASTRAATSRRRRRATRSREVEKLLKNPKLLATEEEGQARGLAFEPQETAKRRRRRRKRKRRFL